MLLAQRLSRPTPRLAIGNHDTVLPKNGRGVRVRISRHTAFDCVAQRSPRQRHRLAPWLREDPQDKPDASLRRA